MDKIYIVTSGIYSNYHIDAVFKNKNKAESYCDCHENCDIEEFEFSDDKIYTAFNYVSIQCAYRFDQEQEINISFYFGRLAEEDSDWTSGTIATVDDRNRLTLIINKKLSEEYDENKIQNEYLKVFDDLKTDIKQMLSEQDTRSFNARRIAANNILEAIKDKIGIDEDQDKSDVLIKNSMEMYDEVER